MKNLTRATLIAVTLFFPVSALADSTPSGGGPGMGQGGPPGGGFGGFAQVREQIDQARTQARTAMLAALTPQHRSLLASVVGTLAITQTPDVSAAAKKLDDALSSNERTAIMNAANALHQQTQQIMESAGGGQNGQGGQPGGNRMYDTQQNASAGTILLRTAVPPMGPPMFFRAPVPPGQ